MLKFDALYVMDIPYKYCNLLHTNAGYVPSMERPSWMIPVETFLWTNAFYILQSLWLERGIKAVDLSVFREGRRKEWEGEEGGEGDEGEVEKGEEGNSKEGEDRMRGLEMGRRQKIEGYIQYLLQIRVRASGRGNHLPESHSVPGHLGCHHCLHHRSV